MMRDGTRIAILLVALLLAAGRPAAAQIVDDIPNDYPTAVRADYVFACMQVNGQTHLSLQRCSCSIDVIASLLSFAKYEEAETILRMRQKGDQKAAIFLSNPDLRAKVDDLRRAQVEGELRCF